VIMWLAKNTYSLTSLLNNQRGLIFMLLILLLCREISSSNGQKKYSSHSYRNKKIYKRGSFCSLYIALKIILPTYQISDTTQNPYTCSVVCNRLHLDIRLHDSKQN
jgi:hypothetical protein